MNYLLKHKSGLIGTIIFHGIILVLLLMYGFFTPLPLPGEEGIVVNFGNEQFGLGQEEPAPQKITPAPVVEEKEEEPKITPPPKTSPPKADKTEESVMTQDQEKTAAIAAEKKKKEKEKKKKEDLEKQKELKEKREKEQIEKDRLAEIDRQEKERKRKEDADRKKKEDEQRKIEAINSRAKNTFGITGQGDPNSKSTGQGVTYKGGNQGSPQGTANSDNYDQGGGQGKGVSYSLGGRSALTLPLPNYPGNEEGLVVVSVTVDKNGYVTKAVAGVKGSTTILSDLLAAAQKAAKQAKFNVDDNAPAFQQGTITYRFVLD